MCAEESAADQPAPTGLPEGEGREGPSPAELTALRQALLEVLERKRGEPPEVEGLDPSPSDSGTLEEDEDGEEDDLGPDEAPEPGDGAADAVLRMLPCGYRHLAAWADLWLPTQGPEE